MKDPDLIHLFEAVDRWKTMAQDDPLNSFHIKIHDYDAERRTVSFSWYDGKDGWEDDLGFDEFEKRFEPLY